MEQQKKYDIFISYSRKDFDEVNAFVEMLKQRIPTLEIWFDLDGIESGDEFRDKIISAIKRSKYVLFALSKNSDQSEWTRKELGFAKGKGIKIVPILLKGAQLQDMDWFLFEFSGVDCIDIIDTKQIDKLIKNLAKWTQKELATLPPEESQKITAQPKVSSVQNTDSTSANSDKRPPKLKSKQWLWVLAAILLTGALGILGWNRYEKQQEIIAKQHYQDSVRLVQQQDSIKEFLRKDSIRVAREKQRQDSIAKAQTAEKKRLERMRQDSIAKATQQKQLKEAEKAQSIRKHNGHEYVDLGLSVMWATMNVGAESPEDFGDYLAFGEVKTKSYYDWDNYKWSNGNPHIDGRLIKYNNNSLVGSVDNKTQLDLSDDAAQINWGGGWRIPTSNQWEELLKLQWVWINKDGVNGYKVTSWNGNSIFIPAAGSYGEVLYDSGTLGRYWSCTLRYNYPISFCINHNYKDTEPGSKPSGCSIRPVVSADMIKKPDRTNKELESYHQPLSEETKNSTPTFGLR